MQRHAVQWVVGALLGFFIAREVFTGLGRIFRRKPTITIGRDQAVSLGTSSGLLHYSATSVSAPACYHCGGGGCVVCLPHLRTAGKSALAMRTDLKEAFTSGVSWGVGAVEVAPSCDSRGQEWSGWITDEHARWLQKQHGLTLSDIKELTVSELVELFGQPPYMQKWEERRNG
jgi:hypothetical protein